MRLHQLDHLLAGHGFEFSRQQGSHRHYHNASRQRLTVVCHGGRRTTLGWRVVEQVEKDLAALIERADTAS